MSSFELLEEFENAAAAQKNDPLLTKLASAKWQSQVVAALIDKSHTKEDIAKHCADLETVSEEICFSLGVDSNDYAAKNLVIQSISSLASKELREHGSIKGEWVDAYIETVKNLPESLMLIQSPYNASSSLSMTLSTHYAKLFSMANDFSFLRPVGEVIQSAHKEIHRVAQDNADSLAQGTDKTSVYQNQLNSLRTIFVAAYRSEADQWRPMLDSQPDLKNLCIKGIPMDGVMAKFHEQATNFQQLMGIKPKNMAHTHQL